MRTVTPFAVQIGYLGIWTINARGTAGKPLRADTLAAMFERLLSWFRSRDEDDDEPTAQGPILNRSGAIARPPAARPSVRTKASPAATAPKSAASQVRVKPALDGAIDDLGPGKNVLVRNPAKDDGAGLDDGLSIFEDGAAEASNESGIDPYNTGKFDRSRHWDKRFR